MGLLHIVAVTLGILAVHLLQQLPPAWMLAALCLPALLPWRGRALWACFALGVLLTSWRAHALLDQRWPASKHDQQFTVQGHVASLPEISSRESGPDADLTARFLFEPEADEFPSRIRVSWYNLDAALTPPPALQAVSPSPASGRGALESLRDNQLRGGDCWKLTLRLKTPHGSLSPGAFDYEGWLFRQGIGATATVQDAQRCDDTRGYVLLRLRQSLSDHLREWLPHEPATGLIAALTFGDTSGLSDADWDVFRLTGTTHLVAISGFNVAIIAGVAFFIFRWLWSLWPPLLLRLPAQKAGMLGAAVVALLYALLAGWQAPVARSVLMLWIILAAAWLQRLAQPSRVLALAWLAILLIDPFEVMAPGLWLSFGAVAAIFFVTTNRREAPDPLRAAIALQLMLSVALTPLTLWFFHGASWCAPLVNLLAVPLFSLMTPILLGALLLAAAWPAVGVSVLAGCATVMQQTRDALGWIAAHVPHEWIAAAPPVPALLLALMGAALLYAPRGLPLRVPALLCFLPLLFPPDTAPRSGFDAAVLDVGQGLSVVVRTAHHAMVFDTGPGFDEGYNAGRSVVAPYLLTHGVRELDLMLISHADNDHSGGAPALRQLLEVR
ncbi:MAG TPA: DNA internalization-related competence protein ComEC/Rec2, partial [Nevskiaceae bacterium]|nr:DNA internalization-related competence protein ComEC/Rec2 [Nevskiaceae bacterium]